MSNKFIVDEIAKLSPAFNLETDVMVGFKKAVNNGQTRLALEYLTYIIDIMNTEPPVQQDVEPKPVTEKKVAAKEATAKAE